MDITIDTKQAKKIEMLVRALADAHQRASDLEGKDAAFAPIEALIFEAYQQAIEIKGKVAHARMLEIASRHGIEIPR